MSHFPELSRPAHCVSATGSPPALDNCHLYTRATARPTLLILWLRKQTADFLQARSSETREHRSSSITYVLILLCLKWEGGQIVSLTESPQSGNTKHRQQVSSPNGPSLFICHRCLRNIDLAGSVQIMLLDFCKAS